MQGVAIGNLSRGKRKGSLIIGNKLVIGPISVMAAKIDDDGLIASLTFVNFEIPAVSVLGCNPVKVFSNSGSAGYIKKIFPE